MGREEFERGFDRQPTPDDVSVTAEIDASYAKYDEHPTDEPDEWGDLASFRAAPRPEQTCRGEVRFGRASCPT